LADDPAQITLLINMVNWVIAVESAFKSQNLPKALADQKELLNELIKMVQGDLTKPMRQKIACMITMDAHSRDIIAKLTQQGCEGTRPFRVAIPDETLLGAAAQ
jgi:dynein heavy chain